MTIRDVVVTLIRRATGAHIYRVLPRGLDLHHDIVNGLPALSVDVIFDVGANIGQSALSYAARYPSARIYCFEPVAATFHTLSAAVRGRSGIECLHSALGRVEGQATMVLEGSPDMFHMDQGQRARPESAKERVNVTTLDAFCRARTIGRINYLKVDVEGAEMDVLEGGLAMFREQRIDLVELEAGMHGGNSEHTPWERFKNFLEPHGYFLFGIYEQVTEWPTKRPQLRRANLAFISATVVEANRVAQEPATPGGQDLHGLQPGGTDAPR